MKEAKFVTEEELEKLRNYNRVINTIKNRIGDLELEKQKLINDVGQIRNEFTGFEQGMIEKYGIDCNINIQTGEVTGKL